MILCHLRGQKSIRVEIVREAKLELEGTGLKSTHKIRGEVTPYEQTKDYIEFWGGV